MASKGGVWVKGKAGKRYAVGANGDVLGKHDSAAKRRAKRAYVQRGLGADNPSQRGEEATNPQTVAAANASLAVSRRDPVVVRTDRIQLPAGSEIKPRKGARFDRGSRGQAIEAASAVSLFHKEPWYVSPSGNGYYVRRQPPSTSGTVFFRVTARDKRNVDVDVMRGF